MFLGWVLVLVAIWAAESVAISTADSIPEWAWDQFRTDVDRFVIAARNGIQQARRMVGSEDVHGRQRRWRWFGLCFERFLLGLLLQRFLTPVFAFLVISYSGSW